MHRFCLLHHVLAVRLSGKHRDLQPDKGAANRVNIGKFLVLIGTGQGLFTILIHIALEFWSGRLALDSNYVTWLTSTATGLGILFAVVASNLTKGKGESIYLRAIKFMLRRKRS